MADITLHHHRYGVVVRRTDIRRYARVIGFLKSEIAEQVTVHAYHPRTENA